MARPSWSCDRLRTSSRHSSAASGEEGAEEIWQALLSSPLCAQQKKSQVRDIHRHSAPPPEGRSAQEGVPESSCRAPRPCLARPSAHRLRNPPLLCLPANEPERALRLERQSHRHRQKAPAAQSLCPPFRGRLEAGSRRSGGARSPVEKNKTSWKWLSSSCALRLSSFLPSTRLLLSTLPPLQRSFTRLRLEEAR